MSQQPHRHRGSAIPSATQNPRFTGIRTFMRLPHLPDPVAAGADVAVAGIPFDTGASFRPGARFGPSAVRDASVLLRASNQHHAINPLEVLNVVDAGDVAAIPADVIETYARTEALWSMLVRSGATPLGIGGDHSVTLGELRGVAKVRGPIALVQLDAHCDTWDNYWGLKYVHGTPFRRAMEEGLLQPGHCVQIGIRGSEYKPGDLDESRALGFEVMTSDQMLARSPAEIVSWVREQIGAAPVFVTIDVDFFDPAFAPGTGTPEVGGPPSWFGLQVLRGLTGLDIVAADVVEVLPAYDPSGVTSLLAATIIFEYLGLLALRRLAKHYC